MMKDMRNCMQIIIQIELSVFLKLRRFKRLLQFKRYNAYYKGVVLEYSSL